MIKYNITLKGIERKQVEFIGKFNDFEVYMLKNKTNALDEVFVALDSKHIIGLCTRSSLEQLANKYNLAQIKQNIIETYKTRLASDNIVSLGVAQYYNRGLEAEEHNLKVRQLRQKMYEQEAARREAYKLKKEQEEKMKLEAELKKNKETYYAGHMIEVERFVELCKLYEIKIPIKTLGWLYKNAGAIGRDKMTLSQDARRSTVIKQYTDELYDRIGKEIDPNYKGYYDDEEENVSDEEMERIRKLLFGK